MLLSSVRQETCDVYIHGLHVGYFWWWVKPSASRFPQGEICLWDVVGVAFESGSVWGEGAHGGGAWELRNCCGDWEECEAFGCRWPRGARARCSLLEMQLLQGRPLQFVPRHAVLRNPARAWLTRKSGRIPMLEFHYLKPLGYVRCMKFSQFSDTGRVRVFEDGFFSFSYHLGLYTLQEPSYQCKLGWAWTQTMTRNSKSLLIPCIYLDASPTPVINSSKSREKLIG